MSLLGWRYTKFALLRAFAIDLFPTLVGWLCHGVSVPRTVSTNIDVHCFCGFCMLVSLTSWVGGGRLVKTLCTSALHHKWEWLVTDDFPQVSQCSVFKTVSVCSPPLTTSESNLASHRSRGSSFIFGLSSLSFRHFAVLINDVIPNECKIN